MILKLLLIVAVISIVYFMFFKKKQFSGKTNNNEKLESNDMVACSTCDTYVEISESILSNNKYYCCKECVEKA